MANDYYNEYHIEVASKEEFTKPGQVFHYAFWNLIEDLFPYREIAWGSESGTLGFAGVMTFTWKGSNVTIYKQVFK